MSTQLTCPLCGATLEVGQSTCPNCKNPVLAGRFDTPDLPPVPSLTSFDLKQPEIPTLDLPGRQLPGLGELGRGDMLTSARVERGRAYRVLQIIGRNEADAVQTAQPFGVAQLTSGDLYVIDFLRTGGPVRVIHYNAEGVLVGLIRQFDSGLEADMLDTPAGIAVDSAGSLYITDMGTCCVKKYTSQGELVSVFGAEGIGPEQLTAPQDVELDANGFMYVADTGSNRVLKWDADGKCVLILGINSLDAEMGWLMAGDGPGELDEPKGVTVDAEGNIWVADSNNHRVQKFSPDGVPLFAFGSEGQDAGKLFHPDDIRIGVSGDIYILDANGSRLQKFLVTGEFIYQIVLPSDAGAIGDFAVDAEGRLLVALRNNGVVLKLEVS